MDEVGKFRRIFFGMGELLDTGRLTVACSAKMLLKEIQNVSMYFVRPFDGRQ